MVTTVTFEADVYGDRMGIVSCNFLMVIPGS